MTLDTYDDRTANPVTCLCGLKIAHGPCRAHTVEHCPFSRRWPVREASHFGMVLGRPDSELCE